MAFWDIGMSDYTSIWFLQLTGQDILALEYFATTGSSAAETAAKVLMIERGYKPVAMHFLPHDANNRSVSGKKYVNLLNDAGIRNIKVVPRTPDLWVGINALRAYLPRFYFSTACEKEFKVEGTKVVLPSGLASIEGYRKKLEAIGGTVKEQPIHNEASHGADALRTFGEAMHRRMLDNLAQFTDGRAKRVVISRKPMDKIKIHR
jgi:hypothetical protein